MDGFYVRLRRETTGGPNVQTTSESGELPLTAGDYSERLRVNYETTQKSVNTDLTLEAVRPGGFDTAARDAVVAEAKRLMLLAVGGAADILADNKAKQGL